MKKQCKTFLEIGAGEKAATHLMPKIRKGDKYIAIDVRMGVLHPLYRAHVNLQGVKNLLISSDAFSLPLRGNTVDHVVSCNVVSDRWFPLVGARGETRGLNFRQALERLEAELHRVTRKGASITFHEYYTPWSLEEPLENDGKSRRQHIVEVFGRRWAISHGKFCDASYDFEGQVIKLFKK